MSRFIKSFMEDESGASAAEYALILVVVGLGIVTAGIALQGAISGAMQNTADCINGGTAEACGEAAEEG